MYWLLRIQVEKHSKKQTQDSLQMLWLTAYLMGLPPTGLYTLCWTHGQTPKTHTSSFEYSFLCPLLLAHHLEYFEFRLECKQFDCGLLSSVYLLHNLIPVCTAQYAETDLISSIIRFAEIRTVLVLMLHFAVSKPVEILSLCTGDHLVQFSICVREIGRNT